jgi:hypothetical protein
MKDKDENEVGEKCWICKRTYRESHLEFKKLVLDFDHKVDEHYIIPSDIKDKIRDDNIIVVPQETDWDSDMLLGFKASDENTGEDIDIKSDHNIFTAVYICPVCDAIFTSVWEGAKSCAVDEIREECNKKIEKTMKVLTSILTGEE